MGLGRFVEKRVKVAKTGNCRGSIPTALEDGTFNEGAPISEPI